MPTLTIHNVRIALAEDHVLVRKALKHFLSQHPNFEVVLDVEDGTAVLTEIEEKKINVDVLLLDQFTPRTITRDIIKQIRLHFPLIKILIISMYVDYAIISDLLELGILGFVSKAAEPSELYAAILSAATGQLFRNRITTSALYWKQSENNQPGSIHFTEMQRKILQLLWLEKSTQEIADEICLSVSAIEKIKHQLKEKIGVHSTVGMIRFAIEKGIIVVGAY
ncbi:MAG: DNA-binding response regulator [Bacteroidetes bacterium]|nr:MAG: DNA-binding response regulator [Bacteroidota bacterium]